GGVVALEDVSLTVNDGEIHGLLGENGAGKSTLMNVLFGLLRPDAGVVRLNGRETRISSPRAAMALGVGMVHQHFKLVPTLTVSENLQLFLGGRRKAADIQIAAKDWLAKMHWTVPLEARVETLTVGQQQRVEIVKALLAMEAGRDGTKQSSRTLIL